MNSQQIFKLLEDIITIGEYFNEDDVYSHIETPLEIAQREGTFPEHSVENGASKVCILVKGMNEVIKIPFSHYYSDDAYEEYIEKLADRGIISRDEDGYPNRDEIDEDIINESELYLEFEYATNNELELDDSDEEEVVCGWDYCALECAYYKEALKEGLGQYFAAEEYFGCIDCHPIYKQQRAIPFYEYQDSNLITPEEKESRSEVTSKRCKELDIYCFNPLWIADFIEMYGENEFIRLNSFLKRFGIGDLRDSNIGYLDGAPILFDYSGYNEGC